MSTNPVLDRKLFKNMFKQAQQYSELISPPKTKEDYMKESKELLESDYVTEKLAIRQQKEEDKAMAMIAFGARLASGRGDPIDILASAAGETVPELAAMRRVTRKEETALAKAIKGEAAQIKQFALSEQKEDEIERCRLIEKTKELYKYFEKDLYTRQAVVQMKYNDESELASCLSLFQFIVRNNKLFLSVFVRSQNYDKNFKYDNDTYFKMYSELFNILSTKNSKLKFGEINVKITSLHRFIES